MRKFILALVALIGMGVSFSVATNYQLTQGTGTTFGSLVVGGVNYAQQFICDATTPTQCAAVSAAGAQKVDGSAVTQPVSGNITANQGGTWTVQPGNTANTTAWLVTGTGGTFPATQSGTWNITNISGTVSLPTGAATAANQTNVQGTVAAGTAAANSQLGGCVYNSSAPTLTTGQQVAEQCDVNGNKLVKVTNTNANGPAAASASSPVTPSNLPPGAAAINTNQVSVAATAGGTLIVAARTGVAGTGRVSATVCNTGTTVVYIGNTGLTTSTGQYLAGVAGACLTLNTTAAIYGIVATGTETVAYSETY